MILQINFTKYFLSDNKGKFLLFFSHYRCAFWKLMIKFFVISMFNVGKTRNKIRSMFRRISIFSRKKLMIEMQESFTIIVELFQKGQKKKKFLSKSALFFSNFRGFRYQLSVNSDSHCMKKESLGCFHYEASSLCFKQSYHVWNSWKCSVNLILYNTTYSA